MPTQVESLAATVSALASATPARPEDFGDVTTDATAAVQAAVDACATSTDPVTTTRAGTRVLELTRMYPVSAPIRLRSVQGYWMRGRGYETGLRPLANMTSVLDINGAARSIFEGFRVEGTLNSGQVDGCIDLYHDPAGAARTTSGCRLSDLWIGGGGSRFVAGLGVSRRSVGAAQVDNSMLSNIVVTGGGKSDATLWQDALAFGNGVQGNQTDYHLFATSGVACKTIFNLRGIRNLHLRGSSSGTCQRVVYLDGPSGSIVFEELNVEAGERLLDGVGASSGPVGVAFRDVQFDCNAIASDGEWIKHARTGLLELTNVTQRNWPATDPPASTKIRLTPAVADALTAILEGVGVLEPLASLFVMTGTVTARCRDLRELVRGTNLVNARHIDVTVSSTTAAAPPLAMRVAGEAHDRLRVDASGQLLLGDGSAAPTGKVLAAATAYASERVDVGELVPSRNEIKDSSAAIATGEVALCYFRAEKSEPINSLTVWTGTTAAGATVTLARLGVFSIAANGDGTLVASTVHDATLWAAANTQYDRSLSATWNKIRGQWYATAVAFVGSGAAPTFHGSSHPPTSVFAGIAALAPRFCCRLTGQTDLPASFTNGLLSGKQYRIAMRLNP